MCRRPVDFRHPGSDCFPVPALAVDRRLAAGLVVDLAPAVVLAPVPGRAAGPVAAPAVALGRAVEVDLHLDRAVGHWLPLQPGQPASRSTRRRAIRRLELASCRPATAS